MKHPRANITTTSQNGYVILGVVIVLAICLTITAGMLQSATGSMSARRLMDANTKNFYEVERAINGATAWLQANSKNIVTAFDAANFNTNFDISAPSVGTNEVANYSVATLVKMKGTTNAVQLTNGAFFGSAAFPVTTNIDTSTTFDAATVFAAADFGPTDVRLMIVWAQETNGSFQPYFRVDAISRTSGSQEGAHGYNFIQSALVTGTPGVGYFGGAGDFVTASPNNQCWSYKYTWDGGATKWIRGSPRSNCFLNGQDDISLRSAIHGSVKTNKTSGIALSGGSISGTRCEGAGCVAYTLPAYPDWGTQCSGPPSVDITAAALTVVSSGAGLTNRCKRDIEIPAGMTVKFDSTTDPYYIRKLKFQSSATSKVIFNTVGPGNKYTLYIDEIDGGTLNGNQLVSTNLAPNQLEINFTKDGNLNINGTAPINALITGRDALAITIDGGLTFAGAVRSGTVRVAGNVSLGYDEDIGGAAAITDMNFILARGTQRD